MIYLPIARFVLFVLLILAATSQLARAKDVGCLVLDQAEDGILAKVSDAWDHFLDFISPNIKADTNLLRDSLGRDEVYWISVSSGVARVLSCDASETSISLYYPIGTIFRPEAKLELDLYEEDKTPILATAEYGLRLIVPREHLRPIGEDDVYFVADGPVEHKMCKVRANCRNSAQDAAGPAIHPDYGYALRKGYKSNKTLRRRVLSLELLTADPLYGIELSELANIRPEELYNNICRPVSVTSFERGGIRGNQEVYLSLCAEPAAHAPLRAVTLELAKRKFAKGTAGSYHRFIGGTELVADALKFGELISDKAVIAQKTCNGLYEKDKFITAAGVFGLGGDVKFARANFTITGSLKARYLETYPTGYFFIFSPYSFGSLVGDVREFTGLSEIEISAKCEGTEPKKPGNIVIYNPHFEGNVMILEAHQDFFEPYTKDHVNRSFTPVESFDSEKEAEYLRLGKFWQIRDSHAYFAWRDTLRRVVAKRPSLRPIMPPGDADRQIQIRDFFVHLILAAAYDHHLNVKESSSTLPSRYDELLLEEADVVGATNN